MKPIRVLVIDDSEMFRTIIKNALELNNRIEVVGTASDPYDAAEKINKLNPEVLTLDIEMPRMNGIEFLKKLMPQKRIPTVVVTSSAVDAFEAISAGAVDYIKKPAAREMDAFCNELRQKVTVASTAHVCIGHSTAQNTAKSAPAKGRTPAIGVAAALGNKYSIDPAKNHNTVIALGASTGGTEALQVVVENLPKNTPGVIIVQHMPAGFTKMYAERLNRICHMEVKEAQDGDRVKTGLIIIGAGEHHLKLKKDANGYYVTSKRGEKVSGHCPSVDVMFESVAETAGANAIGAILTGMGSDGANGLLKMKQTGAYTIGQDKESCIVYGMPMVAFNKGAVIRQAPLDNIMDLILGRLK